jgi:hypothetical protein
MNAAADFNRVRAAFMKRVSAPKITSLALKLAYVIAFKYMNCETQTARPAQESLAADLNVTDRTIRTLLDILEPLGLTIIPGHGPGRASTYCIDPERATLVSPIQPDKRKAASGYKRKAASGSEPNTGKLVHDNRKLDDSNTGSQLPPNLIKRTKKKNQGEKRALHARADAPDFASRGEVGGEGRKEEEKNRVAIDDGFARFWASYPRQKNRDDARAAFGKAIEGGADIEAVVARAAVYALERAEAIRNGDLPKWTPYPATWLKKRNYNDPMPEGVVVDNDTGAVVAVEEPQPQRNGHGVSALAEELARDIEARVASGELSKGGW